MLTLFYNTALFLLLAAASPYLIWQSIRWKKYRASWKEKLGFRLPQFILSSERSRIWIHVVSVGETRALIPLYKKMKQEMPDAQFVISSTTESGHKEAMRSLPNAASYFYLPLDFSWTMKKLAKEIQPELLLLAEGEFWYHLLKCTKQAGAKIVLVNGKLSERSCKRLSLAAFFTRRLFSFFDRLLLQSERYKIRFTRLPIPEEKLEVTGNLKLDPSIRRLTDAEKLLMKGDMGIRPDDVVLVIGSTHAPEEEWLLSALEPVFHEFLNLKVILVPRHPERFSSVFTLAKQHGATLVYSVRAQKNGDEKIILIDEMGKLTQFYQLADLAIVAGSFTDRVGGHNIFEPVEVGVPVLFGPYMRTQLDLVDLVLQANAGLQLSLNDLAVALSELLKKSSKWKEMHQNCLKLAQEAKGITDRTWQMIKDCL